jgi:hypothetical protein
MPKTMLPRVVPFTKDDVDLLAALKTAVYGDFIVGRHLARCTEMIGPEEKVYWVNGITNEMKDLMPSWVYVKTAVMQFKGHSIYDGLILGGHILIGSNMRRELAEVIRAARPSAPLKRTAGLKKIKSGVNRIPKPEKDKERENRITMDIVVDAYNESERATGWYCYLEQKLTCRFMAKCVLTRSTSPLEKGDVIEVVRMASASECEHEIFVRMLWGRRHLAVPLGQLEVIDGNEETKEAVADWHYWMLQGYQF